MKRNVLLFVVAVILGVSGGLAWQAHARAGRNVDLLGAILEGTPAEVRACLDAGAAANAAEESGFTALHCAAFRGNTEIARMLFDRGADANAATRNGGFTPLHVAALQGHASVARLLLEQGARPDARSSDGKTPLDVAHRFHRHEVEKVLSERR